MSSSGNSVKVYLVDTSGSMNDSNKKDQVCNVVENTKIDYLFAFGDNIRGQVDPNKLRNYPFGGGTAIQKSLFEMFEKLKTLGGSTKYLVLATDAEDSISNVEGLKRAWAECQKYHKQLGGFIAGNALFIGSGSGGCTKEIAEVFGRVDVVAPDKVEEFLKKIEAAIKDADECDRELGSIKNRVKQINLEDVNTESTLQQSEQNVKKIEENLEEAMKKTKEIQNEIGCFKNELLSIKNFNNQLKNKLEDAQMKSQQLEAKQNGSLTKSATTLTNVILGKAVFEKKRFEEKIDDTTKNTQQRVNEMERMQEELNNLRSKLKDSNNNSTETVLQQLIAASKEICAQAKQHANQNLQSPKKNQCS